MSLTNSDSNVPSRRVSTVKQLAGASGSIDVSRAFTTWFERDRNTSEFIEIDLVTFSSSPSPSPKARPSNGTGWVYLA